MNDGTIVTFTTPFRRFGVVLHLTNGSMAQTWSLPPKEAEKVVSLSAVGRPTKEEQWAEVI